MLHPLFQLRFKPLIHQISPKINQNAQKLRAGRAVASKSNGCSCVPSWVFSCYLLER
jgi:hypothetical protein